MATEKPRFSVTFSGDTYERIKRYQDESGLSTQSKAVAKLVEMAVDAIDGGAKKRQSSFSDGALKLADDYDNRLDNWGRQAIRELMDTEVARVADEARFMVPMEEPEPKVIPLYLYPAAAGYISPVMNEDYEPYELGPEDPPGAEFAVRLQGDSMEPDFPDGSRVFCNHDPLANGDIGVFCVDSGIVCKQYYKDPVGFVYLFSLNRKRATSDLLISPEGNRSLTCHGRVITRKHYPIPGKE